MGSQFSAKMRTSHQVSPPYSSAAFASPLFPSRKKRTEQSRHHVVRIDILPDDVLLGIFDFYMCPSYGAGIEAWQSLVHVCRRWRILVLESPRRLNLRLFCTPKTPTRDTLDVWPALPLIVRGNISSTSGTDNIIAALGQSNRVCQVDLHLADWQLQQAIMAPMQVPFPELTKLRLSSHFKTPPAIPDSFLGGSAPRLQSLELSGMPFPGLPNLLLSADRLVHLRLINMPHSGYISPEAMGALLAVLSSLELFQLRFRSPQSRPGRETRRPPPLKRSVLPALDKFHFKGVVEYLEDLVTFIDAPQLRTLYITFFNQIDFDCPRLAQFIDCIPTLRALDEAHVQFNDSTAVVKLRYWSSNRTPGSRESPFDLLIDISCREPDWQLSSLERLCNSSLPPLSTAEDLYIKHRCHQQLVWKNDALESTLWLQLLLPFTAAKNLYLSEELAPGVAAALQELVGGRITQVLPSLQNIFVEGLESEPSGPLQENISQFVVARWRSGDSIAVSVW